MYKVKIVRIVKDDECNMCTNGLVLRNKSQYVNPDNFLASYEVPCGKCPTDQAVRAVGYKLRLYYETLGCAKDGGFTIFDTLTYKPEDLPHYRGLPCFNHQDVVDFRKLLRIRLERSGFTPYLGDYGTDGYKDLLKTFVVSEYGSTTCRPHYHIMLWCRIPGLAPTQLHNFVHSSWTHGFTDKKLKIVDIKKNGIGAIHYVSKYMTKSNEETKTLKDTLLTAIGNTMDPDEVQQIIDEKRSHFSLRCWSSKGLGEYAFEWLEERPNYKKIFMESGRLPIPDAKNQIRLLSAPHFYKYRRFYDRIINEKTNRKDRFVLNRLGQGFKETDIDRRIDNLAQTYREAIGACTMEELGALRAIGYNYLNSEEQRNLAIYALVFDGRCVLDATFEEWREVYADGLARRENAVRNPRAWNVDSKEDLKSFDDYCHSQRSVLNDSKIAFYSEVLPLVREGAKRLQEERDEKSEIKTKHYDALRAYRAKRTEKRIISFAQLLTARKKC